VNAFQSLILFLLLFCGQRVFRIKARESDGEAMVQSIGDNDIMYAQVILAM
tara:strand:+ start:310 stop:462 length:153 start_codon:yes stop_codon:yes gene_type:complete